MCRASFGTGAFAVEVEQAAASVRDGIQLEVAVEALERGGSGLAEGERPEPSCQLVDELGGKDLSAKGERADSGGDDDRATVEVVGVADGFSGVKSDTYPDVYSVVAGFESLSDRQRAAERVRG